MTNRRQFLNLVGLGIAGMAGGYGRAAGPQEVDPLDADLVVWNAKLHRHA
jgi:hypothetical protein